LLEQKDSQEGIKFSICRRRRRIKSLGGLSTWKSSEEVALQCARTLQECRLESLRIREKKLRTDSALCAWRPCRGVGVIESLEDSGAEAQEGQCFRCTESWLQGVQRLKNSLEEFRVYKAQERQRFHTRRRGLKFVELAERKEAKVEAFEKLEFFPSRKKVQKLRRKHNRPIRLWKRSGPLKISRPGESRRSAQKRRS
jgi:hypothetical protein